MLMQQTCLKPTGSQCQGIIEKADIGYMNILNGSTGAVLAALLLIHLSAYVCGKAAEASPSTCPYHLC